MKNKMIIYQVFTRLFGNDKTACIPYGSKTENGWSDGIPYGV